VENVDAIVKSIRENLHLNNEETPICITVEKSEGLFDIYTNFVRDLFERFKESNIHVIEVPEEGLGASVFMGLQFIKEHYPGREYLYHVQHIYKFAQPIDTMALVEAMRARNGKAPSEKINYIFLPFRYGEPKHCGGTVEKIAIIPSTTDAFASTTSSLCRFCLYTDSTHLVEFEWYYNIIDRLGYRNRTPESAMRVHSGGNQEACDNLGLTVYVDDKEGFPVSLVE